MYGVAVDFMGRHRGPHLLASGRSPLRWERILGSHIDRVKWIRVGLGSLPIRRPDTRERSQTTDFRTDRDDGGTARAPRDLQSGDDLDSPRIRLDRSATDDPAGSGRRTKPSAREPKAGDAARPGTSASALSRRPGTTPSARFRTLLRATRSRRRERVGQSSGRVLIADSRRHAIGGSPTAHGPAVSDRWRSPISRSRSQQLPAALIIRKKTVATNQPTASASPRRTCVPTQTAIA